MIEKVQFRNFKAYRSLDLELEPFTVLVGPNASGKTTLLEGLHLVSQVARASLGKADDHQYMDESMRSYGLTEPANLGVTGTWTRVGGTARVQEASYSIHTAKGVEQRPAFTITGSWAGRDFPVSGHETTHRDRTGDSLFSPPLSVFRNALGATAVLRFEPRRLAESSYSDEEEPSLSSDGSGLASVLAHYKLSRDEAFREIEDALRQIVPAVQRIRIERAIVRVRNEKLLSNIEQPLWGNQLVLDMKGAKGVPASAAGEGTLMALGLLAVVLGPAQPHLVLLDDIELALHPAAQARLVEVLRKIQKHKPELQIVATSHSPFILNYLDPKEVRMTFLAEHGFARCEKLTAHPEYEKWKDLMAPGEFWSTVGEAWIGKLGGAAANE
ncbi:AAA family ATPase [Pyxidicoccus sp. 3LFB2]